MDHTREVAPRDGGCWICHRVHGLMLFSTEFDSWVHLECVRAALKADPSNKEARILWRELSSGQGLDESSN